MMYSGSSFKLLYMRAPSADFEHATVSSCNVEVTVEPLGAPLNVCLTDSSIRVYYVWSTHSLNCRLPIDPQPLYVISHHLVRRGHLYLQRLFSAHILRHSYIPAPA